MRISVNWPDGAPDTESVTDPVSVPPSTCPANARIIFDSAIVFM